MPLIDDDGQPVFTPPTVSASTAIPGLQGRLTANPRDRINYINPPPDRRLNSILSKTRSPLRRGIIQQTDDITSADGQLFPYACQFMFNPGAITVGYSVAEGVTPVGELTPDQLAATAVYPGATTISFSLLFDRTYEVHYPVESGQKNLKNIGVYADVAMLEQVTGVRSAPKSTTDTTGATQDSANLMGNMLYTPVYVIFGGGNGGEYSQPVAGLTYVGYITSMTVSYGLFSQNMVPTRCGVEITMQQLLGRDPLEFQQRGGTAVERGRNVASTASARSIRA